MGLIAGSADSGSGLQSLNQIVEITMGLWASYTLVAAEEVGLFDFLSASGKASVAETAAGLGIETRPAETLLVACTSLGLTVSIDGQRFANSPAAELHLVRQEPEQPEYFGTYVRMLHHYLYPGWEQAAEAIRSNSPARYKHDSRSDVFGAGSRPEEFWDGLSQLSAGTARVIAEALDFGPFTSLLDVGGGGAAFPIELCRRYPQLRAVVYDLPRVCDFTQRKISAARLEGRISTLAGDFFADGPLPAGHDVILLSQILHDWPEERDRALLAKCYQALPEGGLLVVSELLVNDDRSGPADAALMGMNMLVGTWGRNYSAGQYASWLSDAGFGDVRTLRFQAPGANGAVLARK